MNKSIIATSKAPQAIGTYSQAVRCDRHVYISGQIPLDPETMQLVTGIEEQIHQVFNNLSAVCQASGGSLNDIVKLTIYLISLDNFAALNTIMAEYFEQPYPARAAVGIAELPKASDVEMDAIMYLSDDR